MTPFSTPDELREAVRERLSAKTGKEGECPRCGGTGRVTTSRPVVTHAELADIIGVGRTAISSFLAGRQDFGMAATLRLIAWLDMPEPPATDR